VPPLIFPLFLGKASGVVITRGEWWCPPPALSETEVDLPPPYS